MKGNGFVIGLLATTLVVGGGFIAFGVMQGSKYQQTVDEYATLESDVRSATNLAPSPTEENAKAYRDTVTKYRGKVEAFQGGMQSFAPELEATEPKDFQTKLLNVSKAIIESANRDGMSLPSEEFAFGMENYLGEVPTKEAATKLNFQLDACDWLIKELLKAKINGVLNFVREPLPIERGEVLIQPIAQTMPLELVFFGDEDSVIAFLSAIESSKEFFFSIGMLSFSNGNSNPPNRESAALEELAVVEEDDEFGFGDFGTDDDVEDNPESVVDTSKILGQIAGAEQVFVALQMDLILFNEAPELPEIRK